MTECVYQSTHPTVLAAVIERQADWDRWTEGWRELTTDLFGPDLNPDRFSIGDSFAGFDRYVVPQPPNGWKVGVGKFSDLIVPNARTTAGKGWKSRIDHLGDRPDPAPPGMPGMFIGFAAPSGGFHVRKPAWDNLGGVVYCLWGEDPQKGIDPEIWSKAKMSDFYKAKEAAAEEKEEDKP